ncbi:transposase [Streptomyces hirsutus]|uniref:transposase n=1 Tax=Streptomyces hirsutus TaxID=35620 RepID=UPI003626007B
MMNVRLGWGEPYAHRDGVEDAISQGGRAFGLRQYWHRGLAKARLQHQLTATAGPHPQVPSGSPAAQVELAH